MMAEMKHRAGFDSIYADPWADRVSGKFKVRELKKFKGPKPIKDPENFIKDVQEYFTVKKIFEFSNTYKC